MKKIFLLVLLAALFAACSSSDDDEGDDRSWKGDKEGYNPVVGQWSVDMIGDEMRHPSKPLIYRFSSDRKWYITEKVENGNPVYDNTPTPYQINDDQIMKGNVVHLYKLSADKKKLTIDSPGTVYTLIPYVNNEGGEPSPY